ncbi:MAG: DNA polymerase III subunit alpha [Hyphomicrobiaceae bacterium]|nr:DNA polymerase III subunit alpha [Hyphomicrobiaceae bacterium]MCC0009998.1 DNA polymerase III subunit alpha [Hyphomicrobiaceae bacterium]
MTDPIRQTTKTAAPALPRYIPLKVHSSYSLLEGALPIAKLAKLATAYDYPAMALTDTNNMFGALEFSEKLSASGIQPIAGISVAVDFGADANDDPVMPHASPRGNHVHDPRADGLVTLLAMNEDGYASLMKIASRAFLGPVEGKPPHVGFDTLVAHAAGIIALSGGPDGPIDRALRNGQREAAATRLAALRDLYADRLYVELQRHGTPGERDVEPQLIQMAYAYALPLVATNEVYFATPGDYEAHDALLCIAEGRYVVEDNRRRVTAEHYFKSADEMAVLFADLPEALENTVEIAIRCAYRPKGRKPILPRFVAGDDSVSEIEQFRLEAAEMKRQAEEGLTERLKLHPIAPGFTREDYEKRLAYEVDVITRMKFPGYFLIVADFIKWAKANGIPVGPGRGSGAGSLVAWSLTITDLDPLRFGLLFERFLNPERISMPDFDIDFCQDRRDEVIRYVQRKYGEDRVAQIITHGKLQARAVLRDVGRVLQMPYGQVDRLCKLVPNNPANPVTLPEAIEGEPKLQEERDAEPIVARLLEIAQKLEGLYRHASTHAAGMVIGDRQLDELVPLYKDPKSSTPVTQFNWKMVEAAGLVKFDFLGLKTLTVLQKAVEFVKRGRGIDIDLPSLPLDDKKSYELLARADTVGVFQLESTGMRESLKKLRPDRFEDIIAMVALYRPGPMDNIPTYINRKHGEEPVDYLHDMLKGILEETYGVIIYQEQVIQIAQVMGGYTLGQADMLRRAMGKKDKDEMARQQARFVEGAIANNVKKQDASYIFELVNKFAGYGFNKSHAAAYALVSYHTAYMKANFREEFLAASMTLDMSNTDKLALFVSEASRSGIAVKPPCINESGVSFLPEPPARDATAEDGKEPRGAIRYSLAALKNIGESAVETIITAREEGGAYKTLGDFSTRISSKALNKRAIETLAKAGAFDAVEANRAAVAGNADTIMATAHRTESDAALGTSDLFGGGGAGGTAQLELKPTRAWTPMERLTAEFDAVGFYLSGHPLDQYAGALAKLGIKRYTDFEAGADHGSNAGRLAGIVVSARERKSQRGNKFAFAMFSDMSGQFEAVIFSDTLNACGDLLKPGTPVVIGVEAERDGDTLKLRVNSLEALDEVAASVQSGLKLILDSNVIARQPGWKAEILERLIPRAYNGRKGGEIRLVMELPERGRELEFKVPGSFDVSPQQAGALSTVPGVREVVEL